jgi:hypothetical protein|tara:strand:- start:186 stop:425 length:240 start_codon:yes stop_codon:yes gene_type:complete
MHDPDPTATAAFAKYPEDSDIVLTATEETLSDGSKVYNVAVTVNDSLKPTSRKATGDLMDAIQDAIYAHTCSTVAVVIP